MTSEEYQIALGELFYNAKSGEDIYRRADKYRKSYYADKENNVCDGLVFLAGCIAAFFEGYIDEDICFFATNLLGKGFEVFERPDSSLSSIRSGILQYAAEHYESSHYPKEIAREYARGTDGIIGKNEQMAYAWIKRAANAGDADCQYIEGNKCEKARRMNEAKEWWEKASKQGHTDAMVNLSQYYFDSGNYPMAGHWLEIAAKKGSKDAKKALNDYFYWDQRHQMWWRKS